MLLINVFPNLLNLEQNEKINTTLEKPFLIIQY